MVAQCAAGWKRADDVRADDYLASRDEHDPNAPVVWNRVEEVFIAQGEIWELRWQDRTVRTTAEHPFYVFELGWTPARELKPGMLLATYDGRYLPLEAIASTGRTETVYNFRIAEGHTYFVGTPQWNAALWVHNACRLSPGKQLLQSAKGARASLRRALGGVSPGQQAHHIIPWELRNHSVIKRAAKEGFGINSADNGILLDTTVHLGSHPKLSAAIQSKLDSISAMGLSDADATAELRSYVSRLRAGLSKTTAKLR
ncbi:MAG: polymorphic toxin-type HINT domain-containing protein [Pirellulales bacterium]